MGINVDRHINSLFSSISYRCGEVLFDPGDEWAGFFGVDAVILTHAHFDHIYGLNKVIEVNPDVKVFTNELGRQMLLHAKKNLSHYHDVPIVISDSSRIVTVNDGDELVLGNKVTARAVFTPGHNPSCITWAIDDCIFTGDSYIPGAKIVTNLPGGNKLQAEESLSIIKKLADGKNIYPGHFLSLLP